MQRLEVAQAMWYHHIVVGGRIGYVIGLIEWKIRANSICQLEMALKMWTELGNTL